MGHLSAAGSLSRFSCTCRHRGGRLRSAARFQAASLLQASGFRGNVTISRLNAHQGSATAENKRLRAELDRLDRIVNPPPPEPTDEPPPKPRAYGRALGDDQKP